MTKVKNRLKREEERKKEDEELRKQEEEEKKLQVAAVPYEDEIRKSFFTFTSYIVNKFISKGISYINIL